MVVQILIVDDELEIREMLARYFRFLGYSVETAANGREAIARLEEIRTDIVISDIMMPEMNGVELLAHIRQEYPMTHAIMITGYVTLDNAMNCMRLGADTMIFKPLEDMSQLEQAVGKAVARIQHWLQLLNDLRAMKPAS
ncbi:MAG: response regulator [Calditrichaeota bacterium]|nr:response regulator [Candidatus Cloacimonadota bacterium]MCA9785243.1 response regulator [Candidatus Cloacimonadota bacterium]MCB1045622.1 response regulator [Calditrichota bacterium]MCB9472869.1 response regulator [Candidatus Delongbacteria bacterium]